MQSGASGLCCGHTLCVRLARFPPSRARSRDRPPMCRLSCCVAVSAGLGGVREQKTTQFGKIDRSCRAEPIVCWPAACLLSQLATCASRSQGAARAPCKTMRPMRTSAAWKSPGPPGRIDLAVCLADLSVCLAGRPSELPFRLVGPAGAPFSVPHKAAQRFILSAQKSPSINWSSLLGPIWLPAASLALWGARRQRAGARTTSQPCACQAGPALPPCRPAAPPPRRLAALPPCRQAPGQILIPRARPVEGRPAGLFALRRLRWARGETCLFVGRRLVPGDKTARRPASNLHQAAIYRWARLFVGRPESIRMRAGAASISWCAGGRGERLKSRQESRPLTCARPRWPARGQVATCTRNTAHRSPSYAPLISMAQPAPRSADQFQHRPALPPATEARAGRRRRRRKTPPRQTK